MMQVFSMDLKGYDHLVDLQLTQGHPISFFNLSQKLYQTIQNLC